MDADTQSVSLRTLSGLSEIAPGAWDALAHPPGAPYEPFTSWAFLEALESSGSATSETGWAPYHVVLEDASGPVGAANAYLKSHSYGEYVFDYGWADAFERAGGRYYPKLQVSTPFTPATSPRLLHGGRPEIREALGESLEVVAQTLGLSSVHVTFATEADHKALTARDWLVRTDAQFHFFNRDYRDYQDFLGTLSSRKRKDLRKERSRAVEHVAVEWVTGSDITEAHWDAFFAFYKDTGRRKWGRPYLTRSFFSLVGERMAQRILLVMAKREGRYVAGALNFIGDEAIYGRHWGCIEDHPFLHFELCYHQAVDFAIAHGLKRVEAGAQGAHKIARGYEPVEVRSAHFITHDAFREAVADYLTRERVAVGHEIEHLKDRTPFKKG